MSHIHFWSKVANNHSSLPDTSVGCGLCSESEWAAFPPRLLRERAKTGREMGGLSKNRTGKEATAQLAAGLFLHFIFPFLMHGELEMSGEPHKDVFWLLC